MTVVYLETSALLTWLLGEDRAAVVAARLKRAKSIVTSVLTLMEAKRALVRLQVAKDISEADHLRLLGVLEAKTAEWVVLGIVPELERRASAAFPVEPVRTLDAIHLASALELVKVYPDLHVLSLDARIVANLAPLGLRRVD